MGTEQPPKRRGRPSVGAGDRSVYVGVTLPSKQFDAFCSRARRLDVSVPEVIRRQLQRGRARGDDGDDED